MKPCKRITGWTILDAGSIRRNVMATQDAAEKSRYPHFLNREEWHTYRITLVRQPKRRAKRGGR